MRLTANIELIGSISAVVELYWTSEILDRLHCWLGAKIYRVAMTLLFDLKLCHFQFVDENEKFHIWMNSWQDHCNCTATLTRATSLSKNKESMF